MAKKEIHPELHEINVNAFNRDGSVLTFKTRSTKQGDQTCEYNIYKHQAWTEENILDASNSVNMKMNAFINKFKYKVNN